MVLDIVGLVRSHVVRPSDKLLEKLAISQEYAEYIINNCGGSRMIGNGDTLVEAMEDYYLWEDFLESIGIDPTELS